MNVVRMRTGAGRRRLEGTPTGFPREELPATAKASATTTAVMRGIPATDGGGKGASRGVVEAPADFIYHLVRVVLVDFRFNEAGLLPADGLQLEPFHDPCG